MTTLFSLSASMTPKLLTIGYHLLEVLIVLVPVLLSVAFMTIIERKQLAFMQRRVGPNTTGYYGILQPFKILVMQVVIKM